MVANYLGGYTLVYMLAFLADFAPAKQGDSAVSRHIVFNSARPFTIKRTAADHKAPLLPAYRKRARDIWTSRSLDRFWRAGADAATKICLDHPLLFNGKELPAGEYSIFTMPAQNGWTIMFNKDADIWGTEYNPDHDALRVPMSAERLPVPVELLTIDVLPTGDGGAIEISWDTWKAAVRFTTKS
jgi:Protein of unknown function (DUF2911)